MSITAIDTYIATTDIDQTDIVPTDIKNKFAQKSPRREENRAAQPILVIFCKQ